MLYYLVLIAILLINYALASQSIPVTSLVTDQFCEEDHSNLTLCTFISNEPIIDPCQDTGDQAAQCPAWSIMGECDKNPNYMLVHCARSCEECPSFSDGSYVGKDFFNDPSKLDTHQKAIGNEFERQNTILQIREMDIYNETYVFGPDIPSKTRTLCINKLDYCAYYAIKGFCENKVVFMMNNCPLACMMCEIVEQFHECVGTRHPHSYPSFVDDKTYSFLKDNKEENSDNEDHVYSIDSFFIMIKEKKLCKDYVADFILQPSPISFESINNNENKNSVKSINNDFKREQDEAWMVQFENFLSLEECEELQNLGNEIGWTSNFNNKMDHFTGISKNYEGKDKILMRVSETAACSSSLELCSNNAALSQIIERIVNMTQIPIEHFEIELSVYPESKGYYKLHHDNGPHDYWKLSGPRVLSFFIPLSNVEKGGFLGFPRLNWLMVPTKMGQMVVWPNVLNSSPMMANQNMLHEILPVVKDDLYVLHIWARLFDYQEGLSRNCN